MSKAFGRQRKTGTSRKAQPIPDFDPENLAPKALINHLLSSTSRATEGTEPLVSEVQQSGRVRANYGCFGTLTSLRSQAELPRVAKVLVLKSLDKGLLSVELILA